MAEQRQLSSLKDSTDPRISQLERLKEIAENGLDSCSIFSRNKRKLLYGVWRDANESLLVLEAWTREVSEVDQTTLLELLKEANSRFDDLDCSVEAAILALTSRLRHRKLSLRGLFFTKRYCSFITIQCQS